jgi:TRAP transporter TAXI family solute receptor
MTLKLQRRAVALGGLAATAMLATGRLTRAQAAARSYILATATTGGTYYPVGVALATLVKVKLQASQNIDMSAISSAGSGENVKLLRENQAQFAILQGIFGQWAYEGTGMLAADGPQEHLRSICMLWQNVEHFLATADVVKTGTMDDYREAAGLPFSIGARNSGTEGSGREILSNMGIDPESFELVYLGYGPTAEGLQNGTIKLANVPGGVPVSAITQAFAAMGERIRVLDFTDEQMAAANGDGALWTRYVIPAGSYPGQTSDINTIAQPNFLACREDVDEEAVYLITKTTYENLPFLQNIHPATKAMSLETALDGLPMPLHPGAMRYFEEAGLEIPDRLRPSA